MIRALGGGVTDRLTEQFVDVLPFIAGERAYDSERFLNRRAESWWLIRDLLKTNELDLPPDNKLAADLTNIKFSIHIARPDQARIEGRDQEADRAFT
jgi:hypothetical protein